MKRLLISFSVLILILMVSQAFALVVDDFSGDLSAYTKSVVLTNSGDDEATALSKTNFVINAGQLELSTSSSGAAYQTTFLRDDYSLAVGQRLQADLISTSDISDMIDFGLCVAGQKAYPFGGPRENYLTSGLSDGNSDDPCNWQSYMFNGTEYSTLERSALRSTTVGFYIDRLAEDVYLAGFVGNDGLERYVSLVNYAGGADAIGFYVDARRVTSPLAVFDNLEIVESSLEPIPGIAPGACYDFSSAQGQYVPENTFDAEWLDDGMPSPSNMWVAPDDTPGDDIVNGHIIYDMGSAMELTDMTIWSRNIGGDSLLPQDIVVFGFADDDPANILGDIDDVENDSNIVEIWSGTLEPLNNGAAQSISFDTAFTGQYIGVRVDSSYAVNFQIGEVRFNAVPEEDFIPGDANHDGKVDGSDVTILAGNWQAGVPDGDPLNVTWEMGDFNSDGKVDGSDVTILAGNWQYGVTSAATSVPEPSISTLLLIGFLLLGMRKKFSVS